MGMYRVVATRRDHSIDTFAFSGDDREEAIIRFHECMHNRSTYRYVELLRVLGYVQ